MFRTYYVLKTYWAVQFKPNGKYVTCKSYCNLYLYKILKIAVAHYIFYIPNIF
jgi:hypothetical protein